MAKKSYDIDTITFDRPDAPTGVVEQPGEEKKVQRPVAPVTVTAPVEEPTPEELPVEPVKTMQPQKKQGNKQTRKQVSSDSPKGKHTFEIPNDVWADFEILLFVLQQQGNKKTQFGFITELLQAAIEENRDLIDRYKKMFGVK